ncbi:O-antigen/teichoic acid export membrane protein [Arcticibacter tournemirensis]|uniref:Oligosaccharide flippase family protein n=1 Tax=Arcticibacter tournemirensis TaxID=699437 RepID=A0A5M9HCT9_9SPHI|nr:oligosaccharide flippase family protein [Arcticibacter tournemirensis]KAA8484693.1 oligosaccharide flippase family protein [Arcticibacter tournemirensis]TQM47012.1 O-antigen/teichoic acid export membrane protein [Arcticibacter tournemirensis]
MSTLKKFAGQTAIYGISTVISRFLNFILTPIYVGLYPAKVYGILTTLFSWASILNAILSFGMETTFFRFLNKHGNKRKVYSNTFFTVAVVAVAFTIIALFASQGIARWMYRENVASLEDYKIFIKLFIWILCIDALSVIPFAKLRADGRPIKYATIKLINISCFVGINLFFLFIVPLAIKNGWPLSSFFEQWFRHAWVGYVFIANLVASIVTLLLLLPELLQLTFDIDTRLISEMFLYSFPVLIANLSFIINENSDKLFLEKLLPGDVASTQVGIYGACSKIAIFLSIFIQAFRLGAEPFFFSYAKNRNAGETYAKIMHYFIIAISLIFVALVANIDLLKYFIRSHDPDQRILYWSGLQVVPVLLFGYVSLGIYMNLSIWYKLSDQTRYGLYISGIGAILTIVLNVIFIPKYSYIASAWISLFTYFTMMVLSYILGQKNYPIPYNLKKALLYLILAILTVVLSFNVFQRNIIAGNVLLVIFAAIAFFKERKELLQIMGKGNERS